jgi:uncharacterized DUF497 family protein
MKITFDPAKNEQNVALTPRDGAIRVISLRKANKREIKRYDTAQARS